MRTRLQKWRELLAARPDTEHETALLRPLVGTVVAIVLWMHWDELARHETTVYFVVGMAIFYALSLAILVDIWRHPGVSVPRRYLGIVLDTGGVTATLLVGSSGSTQGLMLVYLWVTLANGLRFGQQYLVVALCLSVASFAVVATRNAFWQQSPWLAVELTLCVIAVALYVRTLVGKLHRAMAREAAANAAKGRFVSRMSHEIRTPLMAVLAIADIVLGTKLRAEQRQMMTLLRDSSMHLRQLIDDILDFSKIDAGKLTLEVREVNVRRLVWGVASILHAQAQSKGIELVVHVDPATPAMIYTDELRLRQILLNLVGNAVKFTERGHVRITVTHSASDEPERPLRLAFAVDDTGLGIPAEKLRVIFESFAQADESITRKYGGTGLGVTISQQLVKLMGGEITVESAIGRGSTFRFEIAVKPGRDDPTTLSVGQQPWAALGFREADGRELQALISGWGIHLVHCPTVDALSRWSENGRRDVMPAGLFVCDGPQTADTLAELHRLLFFEATPVVLCTADASVLVHPPNGVSTAIRWPCERFDVFRAIHFAGVERPVAIQGPFAAPDKALRILVVDDVLSNRVTVRAALESYGHACEDTASAAAALERYAAGHFDVIVCDINMPEMDGITLVTRIRALEVDRERRAAIVMLTGESTEQTHAAAIHAGVDAFLSKPIRPSELAAAVAQVASGGALEEPVRQRASPPLDPPLEPNDDETINAIVIDDERVAELASLRPEDRNFVPRLQREFIDEAQRWLDKSRAAFEAGDVETIRAAVHAVEGAAGSIGFCRIEVLCRAHRGLRKSELHTRAARFVRTFAQEFNAAQAYVLAQTLAQDQPLHRKPR